MVVDIGLALLSMPDSSHIVLILSTIVVMSGMLAWSRLDKREQTNVPATAQRADTYHHED